MRVLINGWFWGQNTTGSGQYLRHLLGELPGLVSSESGTITLVVPGKVNDGSRQQGLPPDVTGYTLPLINAPRQLAKLWWEQVTIPRLALRHRADVLWVPYWAAPLWQPVPTVVTIHDLIPLLLPAYRGGYLQQLYTQLVSWSARRADAIVTVSEASRRDVIQHLGVDAAQVQAVLSGANAHAAGNDSTGDRSEHDEKVRRKYNLPAHFFLYLGGFDSRKNVRSVLDAYNAYLRRGGDPEVHLVIAGTPPETNSEIFTDPQRIADELDLSKQTHFCGFVMEEDKPSLYRQSTAYLFPSLYEGFGLTVIEAMSAGTPVITSKK